ncbi:MAG: hypothetical protein J6S84_06700 [Bacteroidales bacterium]|nr:hypothetical protein [Bacteroidales bacterium]
MNKVFRIFVIVSLLLSCALGSVNAQTKAMKKALDKEYKEKVKFYSKGGWTVFGTSRTLDVALLKHYEKLNEDGVTEVYGTTISGNKNIGKDKLLMSACAAYAQKCGSNIKGRITEDMGSVVSTEELEEFEHFYAAYENNVQTQIQGELTTSFSVYRPITVNGKDVYEFETYFIVDETAASKARIRAFQNAMKESAVAQKYAESVSKFIEEGNPMNE